MKYKVGDIVRLKSAEELIDLGFTRKILKQINYGLVNVKS